MDRLSLSGLKTRVRVGCTTRERASAQILELDVDLFLPLARAGLRDDLTASVDYSALAVRLRAELEGRAWEIDKSREVIVYCASVKCDASRRAAEMLTVLGFDVKAYEGGIKEWKEAGLPIE